MYLPLLLSWMRVNKTIRWRNFVGVLLRRHAVVYGPVPSIKAGEVTAIPYPAAEAEMAGPLANLP
jgi:hypothetical protein